MHTKIYVEGHRGATTNNYENTMEAFLRANELGIDGIEFDVWLLKDGVPIIIHGGGKDTMNYFWNSEKNMLESIFLNKTTSQELKKYRLLDKRSSLPTFRELVCALRNSKLYLNCELKEAKQELTDALIRVIFEEKPTFEIKFSSFDFDNKQLLAISAKKFGFSEFGFGYITSSVSNLPHPSSSEIRSIDNFNFEISLILQNSKALREYVIEVKKKGVTIKTFNPLGLSEFEGIDVYHQIMDMGVDTFTCNRVERLMEFNKQE